MAQLPLQIRKDIRDLFDNEDSAVQRSIASLKDIIGYHVACTAEWHMLWVELEPVCPDKTTFVPTVAKLVETWCDTLGKRLEDARFASWTEVFLENLKTVNAVKFSIQVTAGDSRVRTAWLRPKSTSFTISLPKTTRLQTTLQTAGPAFAEDFESMFDPPNCNSSTPSNKPEAENQHPEIREDDEDWAELESVADTTKSTSISTTANRVVPYPAPLEPSTDVLPALETLPRPEILFRTTSPYVMLVSSGGQSKLTVNGTHEPSLRLLAEYLQRWTKTDPQDVRKIPYLRIKLNESNFGLGLFRDSLTIEPFDYHQRQAVVNVTLVLAFIQGVLGYRRIPGTSGAGQWEFQRDTPFAA
ncbi:hypothetical protein AYO21_01347 [Fonsecaea monophora]|uniref:Uncharacterized protein n=1 Tax=Fonsecaea monophora TaxID=254056 RepID=A0A177FKN4_9EURO|nr:hypothetical protein AYO21_01347 [Fonsecaea monophora]OAG44351.1 hypothetical protein AYO21_01347 [Fonsecaea monophora]